MGPSTSRGGRRGTRDAPHRSSFGKSQQSKALPKKVAKKHSLKHQLRGQKRILQKMLQSASESQQVNATLFEGKKLAVESTIYNLERIIEKKGMAEIEKQNALKYRGVKFFEKQKLTRKENRAKKELSLYLKKTCVDNEVNKTIKGRVEKLQEELEQIKLDLQYIKFFPNDTKYLALFPSGEYYKEEDVDPDVERERLEIRQRVVLFARGHIGETVDRGVEPAKSRDAVEKSASGDIDQVKGEKRDVVSDSQGTSHRQDKITNSSPSSSDDSSDESATSSSSSSSSSDDKSSQPGSGPGSKGAPSTAAQPAKETSASAANDSDDDDFFATEIVSGDAQAVFQKAPVYKDGVGSASRDKSKGWSTQKQRPGEFKRRRVRN
jgi:hypothetical protein